MFGELEDEVPAAADSGEEKTAPEVAPEDDLGAKEGLWGYVCLGLSTSQLQRQRTSLVITLLGVLIGAVVSFTLFVFFSSARIYRRLVVMLDVARQISEGDLTETIPDVSSDEIGE